MRMIFLGRKPWASRALKEALRRGHEVVRVVASPSELLVSNHDSTTRSLEQTARAQGLIVVDDRGLYSELESATGPDTLKVDLVISFLFWKRILPPLIALPSIGCFNFHPGPLPEFRGRRGYNFAILEGYSSYGATVHWVSDGFDEGDIVKVIHFPIHRHDTAISLEKRTMAAMLRLFAEFLDMVEGGVTIPRVPQGPGRSATKGEMLAAAQVLPTDSADIVERKIRAYWYPPMSGARVEIAGGQYTLVSDELLKAIAPSIHRDAEVGAGLIDATDATMYSGLPQGQRESSPERKP